MELFDNLNEIKENLFDAPADIKSAFNNVVRYFSTSDVIWKSKEKDASDLKNDRLPELASLVDKYIPSGFSTLVPKDPNKVGGEFMLPRSLSGKTLIAKKNVGGGIVSVYKYTSPAECYQIVQRPGDGSVYVYIKKSDFNKFTWDYVG